MRKLDGARALCKPRTHLQRRAREPRYDSPSMLELPVAALALLGRAAIQAADAAMLAIGEDDLRRGEAMAQVKLSLRWVREMKKHPEPTAAALRGASSGLLAFAAAAWTRCTSSRSTASPRE